jgi:hypothetical protein
MNIHGTLFGQLDFVTSDLEFSRDDLIFTLVKCNNFEFEFVKKQIRFIQNFNQFILILEKHLSEDQIEELKQLRDLISI